jgi:AraC-like DNA-binding protein
MDPLSDVLSLLKPRSYMFRGLDASGSWSLKFPPTDGIRCYALVSGACWLILNDTSEPVRLTTGDCILLSRGQGFCLASDTAMEAVDAVKAFSTAPEGGVATINGGGDTTGLGGYFNFDGKHAVVLLALLPSVVHIRKESDRATLRSSMDLMMRELRNPQPGGALVAQHLGHMMLVLALRLHLAWAGTAGTGWLYALADKQMGAALNAMHADPAHRWTLQALAQYSSMSRSTFAQRFKETVGEPAMEYLVRWRMVLAVDRLTTSGESISAIAYSVGYQSESAFSAAFRRVMGCTPRQYTGISSPELESLDSGALASGIRLDTLQD